MSHRDTEHPGGYSFEPFLHELRTNWYSDDDLLQALLERYGRRESSSRSGDSPDPHGAGLTQWGDSCSGQLRELAEESALPENRPRLRRFDAAGNRVDEILLPRATREALDLVEGGERLGAVHGDPFTHYAKVYLYSQNGEGGVACSVACTDGLVRALEALGEAPAHRRALREVRDSGPGRVVHGAQFVTEIQGGSDVPANRSRAERDGDAWRLYGQKWFCSNVNADYFLVTARPEGAPEGPAGIGLFLVPARGHGTAEDLARVPSRNGHTVDRLKEKLGTRELATAELTLRGAVGHRLDPPGRGLRALLRYVLLPSRYGCVLFAAGALRRAERITDAYSEFRTAFGRPIAEYARVRESLEEIRRGRARCLAAAFRLLELWEGARRLDAWFDPQSEPERRGTDAVDLRVMLSLCKAELTRRATRLLHESMMLLGGNGIEERFSPLPRLYRDAVIMETWEGPYNVLLNQALRDLERYEVDPDAFVGRIVRKDGTGLEADLRAVLQGSCQAPPPVAFRPVASALVSGFADRVLADL